jgi:hypothetical protein
MAPTAASGACSSRSRPRGRETPAQGFLDRCPELQAASGEVRAFATMITELTGQDLPQWMAAAREAGLPGIASFAKGLEQDLDAAGSEVPLQTAPAAPVPGHRRVLVAQTHQLRVQTPFPCLQGTPVVPVLVPGKSPIKVKRGLTWWAQQGSNLWLLACKASALPLSYAPLVPGGRAAHLDRSQRTGPGGVAAPGGGARGWGWGYGGTRRDPEGRARWLRTFHRLAGLERSGPLTRTGTGYWTCCAPPWETADLPLMSLVNGWKRPWRRGRSVNWRC